jgi:hypothetical protein
MKPKPLHYFLAISAAVVACIVYLTYQTTGPHAAWLVFLASMTSGLFGSTVVLMWLTEDDSEDA